MKAMSLIRPLHSGRASTSRANTFLTGGPRVESPFEGVRAVAAAIRFLPPAELAAPARGAGLRPRQAFELEVAHGARLRLWRRTKPK